MCKSLTNIPKDYNDAFSLTIDTIGPKTAAEKLKCSLTHVYRMKADKSRNAESRKNLISKTYSLLKTMLKKGLSEAYFITVDAYVSLGGLKAIPRDHTPDKETYQEELLDSAMSITNLMDACQKYIDREITLSQLHYAEKRVHDEIGQLVEKAVQEKERVRSN